MRSSADAAARTEAARLRAEVDLAEARIQVGGLRTEREELELVLEQHEERLAEERRCILQLNQDLLDAQVDLQVSRQEHAATCAKLKAEITAGKWTNANHQRRATVLKGQLGATVASFRALTVADTWQWLAHSGQMRQIVKRVSSDLVHAWWARILRCLQLQQAGNALLEVARTFHVEKTAEANAALRLQEAQAEMLAAANRQLLEMTGHKPSVHRQTQCPEMRALDVSDVPPHTKVPPHLRGQLMDYPMRVEGSEWMSHVPHDRFGASFKGTWERLQPAPAHFGLLPALAAVSSTPVNGRPSRQKVLTPGQLHHGRAQAKSRTVISFKAGHFSQRPTTAAGRLDSADGVAGPSPTPMSPFSPSELSAHAQTH